MKKLIVSISCFLMSLLVMSSTLTVYASNNNIMENDNVLNQQRYELSESEIAKLEQEQIDKHLNDIKNKSNIRPLNTEYDYEYITRKSGNPVYTYGKDIGWAGGQQPWGVKYENTSGMIYWSDGGYNTSISIGIGGQLFSASISAGKMVASSSYGAYVKPNIYAKLWIKRDIMSQKNITYRRNIYTGEETYYTEFYTHTPVSFIFDMRYSQTGNF